MGSMRQNTSPSSLSDTQDYFANSVILQDEGLLDVVFVVEEKWPLTPVSLGSLAMLTEAIVLHDKVYFDLLRHTTEDRRSVLSPTIDQFLKSSSLVQGLQKEGAISVAPPKDVIQSRLEQLGSKYEYGEFLADYYWGTGSLSSRTPEGVIKHLKALVDLMRWPNMFVAEGSFSGSAKEVLYVTVLQGLGFNKYDIQLMEDNNHRIRGFVNLANALNCSFCSNLLAMPHQIGQTAQAISKSKETYASILAELEKVDEEVRNVTLGFSRIDIPPLCQVLLQSCRDSKKAVKEELLNLREKYKSFRRTSTDYEKAWENASTRRERLKLQKEYNAAWQELIKKEKEPGKRITHTIWDSVKSPTAPVDMLAQKDKRDQIINKVKGLHDFWKDMVNTPIPERNIDLLKSVFGSQVDLGHWNEAESLAESIEKMINSSNKDLQSP